MDNRGNRMVALIAVALGMAMICGGCASGSSSAPQAGSTTSAVARATPSTAPSVTGKITLVDMCKAFETTAGQNLSKIKQYCETAPTYLQNGNADAAQCVVELQVASEQANNNTYSQQQAYDACNAYNTSDPVGSQATIPGGDKVPLNANYTSLGH